MNIEQIRTAMDYMEQNYSLAMDAGDESLAMAFNDKIQTLSDMLVRKLEEASPNQMIDFIQSELKRVA